MRTPPFLRSATRAANFVRRLGIDLEQGLGFKDPDGADSFLVTSPWRQISGSSHLGSALRSRPTFSRNQTPFAIPPGAGPRSRGGLERRC